MRIFLPLAALLAFGPVQADTVVYQFSGVIDTASPNSVNLTDIGAGDTWSLTVSIDADEPNTGAYNEANFQNAEAELTIDGFGSTGFTRSDVSFQNDYFSYDYDSSGSSYDFVEFDTGASEQLIDGLYAADITLLLTDISGALFSNNCCGSSGDFVLPGFSDLNQFDDQYFSFLLRETPQYRNQAEQAGFNGTILNASVSVVPVPAAVWLFGSALAGLMGLRKIKTTR